MIYIKKDGGSMSLRKSKYISDMCGNTNIRAKYKIAKK